MTLSQIVCPLMAVLCADTTFVEHRERYRIGPNAVDIVAVDLNGDELPEIVTADVGRMNDPREESPAHSQLSLLLAEGDLKYRAEPQLRTGFAPYCIVVANMDVLRAPDLVVGSFLASRNRDVSIIRNVGEQVFETFHFEAPDALLDYYRMTDGDGQPIFTTPGITSVGVSDFDRDGYRDVVATGWSSDVLVYFPGAEETYLGPPVTLAAEGGPRDVEIADLDKDGHADLVVAMYSSNEIAMWQGDGTGAFLPVARFASRGKLPQRVELDDMNGDGRADVVVSHRHGDDSIVIFYGDGGFSFSVAQEIMLGEQRRAIEYEVTDIAVTDLNGDGRPDIAAACKTAESVVVLLNQGSEKGLPLNFGREEYAFEESAPSALCVSDFNRDAKPDIAVALAQANSVALLLGRP